MNPQYVPHAKAKDALAKVIEAAVRNARLTWAVYQEVSVDVTEGFQPLPDIVVWDPAATAPDLDGPIPLGTVRIVIEIADSTLTDDLGEKLGDYAAGGLPEYWVADVKGSLIHRHAGPSANKYARRETARFGEAFPSLVYPGLTFDTATLA